MNTTDDKDNMNINDTSRVLQPSIIDLSDVSVEERESNEQASIFNALNQEYAPITDELIRVVEVQRRVSSLPRIEPFILSTLMDIQKALSTLENRQVQITEELENTSKIYNATIYDLNNDKYILSTPIQVVLIEESDETIARIPELNLYTVEDSGSEAIFELKGEIVSLYEDLISSHNKLGPLPKSWLNTLNKLIVTANA